MSAVLLSVLATAAVVAQVKPVVLNPSTYQAYIERFNREDRTEAEMPTQIPNKDAWEFLAKNVPLFDCPDKEFAPKSASPAPATASPVGNAYGTTRSSAPPSTAGTPTPATNHSPSTTKRRRNGCCGTTVATAAWSRSASLPSRGAVLGLLSFRPSVVKLFLRVSGSREGLRVNAVHLDRVF